MTTDVDEGGSVSLPTVAQVQRRLLDELHHEGEQGLWEVAWSLNCGPEQPAAVVATKVDLAREAVLDLVSRGEVTIMQADTWPPTDYRPVAATEFAAVDGDAWVAPERADALYFIRAASSPGP